MEMKRFNHGWGRGCRRPPTVSSAAPVGTSVIMVCASTLFMLVVAAVSLTGAEPTSVDYEKDIKPLLSTYCYKCHGAEKHKGDLNLSTISNNEKAHQSAKIWRSTLDKLRVKDMPPEEAPQPTAAEWERLKAGIAILKRPLGPPDPGRVTVRRLNRKEYDNTIHDLIG